MINDKFEYDVFISYSSTDKDWVWDELLPVLERNNMRVLIDSRDFRPGSPTVIEIERAIQISKKTLVILTPSYLERSWTQFELMIVQTLDPTNQKRRLIPLLKTKTDLPPRLGFITYVDFCNPHDWDIAWRQLLTALGSPVFDRTTAPIAGDWLPMHPYGMLPNFTGRLPEQELLTEWFHHDKQHPVLVLVALGGFGKSALVWHWVINHLRPTRSSRVVWWSFYDEPLFDSFLSYAVAELNPDATRRGLREQCNELIKQLHQQDTLLIMDGFERALRDYREAPSEDARALNNFNEEQPHEDLQRDCVSLIAGDFLHAVASSANLKGKVLITTRLRPRALEGHGGILLIGCREKQLEQLPQDDAVQLFLTQGIRGSRGEISLACERYGYHPLSLRLLAGLIINDPQQPGDIAVATRLDISGSLIQRRSHVLSHAYEQLPASLRRLLSQIACFRGAVSYEALRLFIGEKSADEFNSNLRSLVIRGLLHHNREKNLFDLHAIVRHYAYAQLDVSDRQKLHLRLKEFFAGLPTIEKVNSLSDLSTIIECYHHTVRAHQFLDALLIFSDKMIEPLHFRLGTYNVIVELLSELFSGPEGTMPRISEDAQELLKPYPYASTWSDTKSLKTNARAWLLNAMALAYRLSGQPTRAVPLFIMANEINLKLGDRRSYASGLLNLAVCQWRIGRVWESEQNLQVHIALSREMQNSSFEAVGRQELGLRLAQRGLGKDAEDQFEAVLQLSTGDNRRESIVFAHRALMSLLQIRTASRTPSLEEGVDPALASNALKLAERSLTLVSHAAQTEHVQRNDVRANWLMGAASRISEDLVGAEFHLNAALSGCRISNLLEFEADILLDIAKLRAREKKIETALSYAHEALAISQRCHYALQEADVHLFLARAAFASSDDDIALHHVKAAQSLALCDRHPDYTYKVASCEAEMLLGFLS